MTGRPYWIICVSVKQRTSLILQGNRGPERINRQKNMLVAIFEKLKQSDLIFEITKILDAFKRRPLYKYNVWADGGFGGFLG
jgi:hypothetical protein